MKLQQLGQQRHVLGPAGREQARQQRWVDGPSERLVRGLQHHKIVIAGCSSRILLQSLTAAETLQLFSTHANAQSAFGRSSVSRQRPCNQASSGCW